MYVRAPESAPPPYVSTQDHSLQQKASLKEAIDRPTDVWSKKTADLDLELQRGGECRRKASTALLGAFLLAMMLAMLVAGLLATGATKQALGSGSILERSIIALTTEFD